MLVLVVCRVTCDVSPVSGVTHLVTRHNHIKPGHDMTSSHHPQLWCPPADIATPLAGVPGLMDDPLPPPRRTPASVVCRSARGPALPRHSIWLIVGKQQRGAGLGWAGLGWAGLGWAGLAGLGWAGEESLINTKRSDLSHFQLLIIWVTMMGTKTDKEIVNILFCFYRF